MLDTACHVLWATLDDLRPHHLTWLDATERRRREGYLRDADRARFTLATAMARRALADELGVAPPAAPLDRSCDRCGAPHGRPRAPGTGLHLSIAHSGDLAAVAVTRLAPVGIDVEACRDFDTTRLARRVLSPGEAAGVGCAADFLRCWVRKEAILKATGDGLAVPLHAVDLGTPRQPARLSGYPGRRDLRAEVVDAFLLPGYLAAVAVLSSQAADVEPRHARLLDADPAAPVASSDRC